MKAPVTACHCCVDCAPCYRYMADPERQSVCGECGHTAACHQSKGGTTIEEMGRAMGSTHSDAAAANG